MSRVDRTAPAYKAATAARVRRLMRARRDDHQLGIPADARRLRRFAVRLARRIEAHPLEGLHPADAPVLADSLALLVNEAEVVNSILNTPHQRSR